MKKVISVLFGASLLFATSAQAAGMAGIKLGIGELDAQNDAYTAGSTSVAAQSGSADNPYGALFAELEIPTVEGLSLGLEYVPTHATTLFYLSCFRKSQYPDLFWQALICGFCRLFFGPFLLALLQYISTLFFGKQPIIHLFLNRFLVAIPFLLPVNLLFVLGL